MPFYIYIIVAVCLLLSNFFSMMDMAYSKVDVARLKKDMEKGSKRAKAAYKLATDFEMSISGILFMNNVANIFASSFATLIGLYIGNVGFLSGEWFITIILTIFIIIFCEFIPKAFAKRFSFSLSKNFSYIITFFKYLTFIVVWPISKLFVLIGKLFEKKSKEEDQIDEDVLDEMIDTIEEEGILEDHEAEILRGVVDLSDIEAFEIMTPRVDVFALDVEDNVDEYIKSGELFKHSRIPVYEDTIDNIIGVLPVKRLAPFLLKKEEFKIKNLLYEPIIIPRNRQVLDLLDEMKTSKVHIAIIKDEYGGTEGIVTMEDILEEIVGEIFDENDEVEEEFIEKDNGVYIFDGSVNIEDAFEIIGYEGYEELETSYSTIGGFCQEILNRFAKKGDTFTFDHYRFTVLEADEFTVEKLKIEDLSEDEED